MQKDTALIHLFISGTTADSLLVTSASTTAFRFYFSDQQLAS